MAKKKKTRLAKDRLGLAAFLKKNGATSIAELVKIAENNLGITPPRAGEPRSSIKCRCQDAYRISQGKPPRAAPKTRKKWRGKKASTFYKSAVWARLRYDALAANDGKCELCGASKHDGATLHVDHIKPIKLYPERRADLSNLQVLCGSCNWGKGNRDETDWREPGLSVVEEKQA